MKTSEERRAKARARYYARGRAARIELWRYADEVVVDRMVNGEPLTHPPTMHERRAAFERLRKTDLDNDQIALRLRCSERTIERYWKASQ